MGVTMGWSAPAAKARRRVQALLMALLLLMIGFYGLGVQVVSSQGLFIRSFYIPGDLPIDPKSPDWSKATPMVIPLSGQVITRPSLPDPTIKSLTVRALHNGKELAFLLEWQDPTKNDRSQEHTSELQSRLHLVCRVLLEKKKRWRSRNAT